MGVLFPLIGPSTLTRHTSFVHFDTNLSRRQLKLVVRWLSSFHLMSLTRISHHHHSLLLPPLHPLLPTLLPQSLPHLPAHSPPSFILLHRFNSLINLLLRAPVWYLQPIIELPFSPTLSAIQPSFMHPMLNNPPSHLYLPPLLLLPRTYMLLPLTPINPHPKLSLSSPPPPRLLSFNLSSHFLLSLLPLVPRSLLHHLTPNLHHPFSLLLSLDMALLLS